MNFLLDTNVVSEPMRPRPNAGVLKWLGEVDEESTFISVVTITELRYGIERLDGWLQRDLRVRFEGRILPVDFEVANVCGGIIARRESLGRPIEPRDAFIAATAEVYGLTLVTRNVSDFEPTIKTIVRPWI
jgi:predicted nucleic acid-binding protein